MLQGPFEELTLDFITSLLLAKLSSTINNTTYDAILIVIDRFSKRAKYIPLKKDWSAKQFADAMIRHIFHSE